MYPRRTLVSRSFGLFMGLMLTLLLEGGRVEAQDRKLDVRSISVTGTGKIAARPDIAEVHVGVLSEAADAQTALEKNNTAMSRLFQVLKERAVAEKDIQTSQIVVVPQYSQPQPRNVEAHEFIPRVIGYRVENTVEITARQIDRLGPLLDALVQGGANQIRGIQFRVEHPEKLLDSARKDAMADARHRAALLAGEAGVVLGPPLRIEEQNVNQPPTPRMFAGRGMMMAAAAPAMPVSPGEQELSITVSVVYELREPK